MINKLKNLAFLTEKERGYIYLVHSVIEDDEQKVEEGTSFLKKLDIKQEEIDELINILKEQDNGDSTVNDLIADIFNNKNCC